MPKLQVQDVTLRIAYRVGVDRVPESWNWAEILNLVDSWDVEVIKAEHAQRLPNEEARRTEGKPDKVTMRQMVDDYAERLVAAGDLDALRSVFGTDDPNFDLANFSHADIALIFDEYLSDDEDVDSDD